MTPYSDDKTSDFAIPQNATGLIAALQRAQRDYEDAKNASERATQAESAAIANRKALKRSIILDMTNRGVAVTRAEKEYVDTEKWQQNELDVAIAQDKKRSADVDESIYRQRMLTLRAAIVPVTIATATVAVYITDAITSAADDDLAHSADPSVAHTA